MEASGLPPPAELNATKLNETLSHGHPMHLAPSMQLGSMSNPQSRLRDTSGLVVMVTLNAIALLANSGVLAVVVKVPHLRKFSLVCHLCVVDLLCAALLMPLGIVCGSPFFAGIVFSVLECRLYIFLNAFLISASIFTVTVISIERYFYIVHPMRYEAKMTPWLSAAVMGLVWVASTLLGLATVFGWPSYGSRSSIAATHCSLHWSHSGHRRVFAILFCTVCFCVPAAIIIAVYGNVYKVAHTAARARGPIPSWTMATAHPKRRSDSVNSQTTIITTSTSVRRNLVQRRKRRTLVGGKAALTLAIIVGQFLLCWLPYFAFHLHLSLGFSHSTTEEAEGPVTWLAYSTFAVNPFFYGLLNRQIREELCKILLCCRSPGRPLLHSAPALHSQCICVRVCETVYACFDGVDEPLYDLTTFILMTGTMMRSMDARETEIDLRDAGDGEDDEGQQTWKTQLETVLEEEEEDDMISTQSDTRPLINERDPRQINECLKVSFEDVIAEPVSVRSGDRVWIWSHALFEVSRVWFYRIFTVLLAVPVSLLAGVLFAVLSFVHIWFFTPCVQVVLINTGWLQTLWSSVLDIIILPLFQSVAKCCSGISVVFTRE
ncbi:hypothetical protein Q8A67_021204 [Cirrhinus molitorella]|uniref:G-protein coupled receptors family 1 profile domain-containing protein n=1 Tax=Cirrhinus molitorella TaxID=172907 RepID=A0AA88PH36_9TELE|nr:hypothetical protein Q8A67_021204 [Cirrhinus molitorella]